MRKEEKMIEKEKQKHLYVKENGLKHNRNRLPLRIKDVEDVINNKNKNENENENERIVFDIPLYNERNRYEMYVMDISYFSGKLETYFRYKRISFDRIEPAWSEIGSHLLANSGLMKVPVVYDKVKNIYLNDSTSIILYIEKLDEEEEQDGNSNSNNSNNNRNNNSNSNHNSNSNSNKGKKKKGNNNTGNNNNNNTGNNNQSPPNQIMKLNVKRGVDGGRRRRSILPACEIQRFFSYLLEDYADESLWRPALYYRWAFDVDANMNAARFSEEFFNYPLRIPIIGQWILQHRIRHRQEIHYILSDGVRSQGAKDHVEATYFWLLGILQRHLSHRDRDDDKNNHQSYKFLLGNKPTLADFGFQGPFFRHFSIDPTPATLMRHFAPAVYEWVARMYNSGDTIDDDSVEEFIPCVNAGKIPELWLEILKEGIAKDYFPSLLANAREFQRNGYSESKDLTYDYYATNLGGAKYEKVIVSKFRVLCRERLHRRYDELSENGKKTVKSIMIESGAWDNFGINERIPSKMEIEPPFCPPAKKLTRAEEFYWSWMSGGTTWNYPIFTQSRNHIIFASILLIVFQLAHFFFSFFGH